MRGSYKFRFGRIGPKPKRGREVPDFSIAIGLLKKPIEDIYVSTKGELNKKIASLRAASKVKNLHKKLWESQRIKTIWNTDRPLSLSSIFYAVSVIRLGDNAKPIRLTSLDELAGAHNIIFGTVGQGKSILLKFLLGKEIRSGTRIPVLCELRNVGAQELESHLVERFSTLIGIETDAEVFTTFATHGKLSLLLDGFDEIDPDNVQKLTKEIEDISYKYSQCRIVLTSRPDSECRHLTSFSANKICPLTNEDLLPFYKRVTKDDGFSEQLVAAVRASPLKIQGLVTTPLLATLLAISYQAAHKIPLNFAEFYDELFQILLVRHDGSKLGWRRHRKTKLNDREIQQIFEAFCFASRKKQQIAFDKEAAIQFSADSIKDSQCNADPQLFLDDIKKITCLLTDEGKKISFVHASVQEFFAARYVKTRSEGLADKFYKQLLGGKWQHWQEEIIFLQQIDTHRANKYFTIPDIDQTVQHFLLYGADMDACVDGYLKELAVRKSVVKRDGKETVGYYVQKNRKQITYSYNSLDSKAFNILFSPLSGAAPWTSSFQNNPESGERSYYQIAEDRGGEVAATLKRSIKAAVISLLEEKNKMAQNVLHQETVTAFIEL